MATPRRYCGIPGCVEEAVGVLAQVYAPPVNLCEEHLRPIRKLTLALTRADEKGRKRRARLMDYALRQRADHATS